MLNNFCFHVYAQKSLFIAENCNGFFDISITLSCYFKVHRAGSQLKKNGKSSQIGSKRNLNFFCEKTVFPDFLDKHYIFIKFFYNVLFTLHLKNRTFQVQETKFVKTFAK